MALFAVILPAATNPLNQLEESSSERSPGTRNLKGKWQKDYVAGSMQPHGISLHGCLLHDTERPDSESLKIKVVRAARKYTGVM